MKNALLVVLIPTLAGPAFGSAARAADRDEPPEGFVSLFNSRDFTGWKVPAGDNGHWRIVDGVIDYDAESEARGDKTLWCERELGDFILQVDWRIKETPYTNPGVPYILPDGSHAPRHQRQGNAHGAPGLGLRRLPPGRWQIPGQHLVLADRFGRDVWHPHRSQDARRGPRRRHPDPGGQAGGPVESVSHHRARQHRDRSAERQDGHPGRRPCPACPARAHRLPASWRQKGWPAEQPPQPGPVQERLREGTERRGQPDGCDTLPAVPPRPKSAPGPSDEQGSGPRAEEKPRDARVWRPPLYL